MKFGKLLGAGKSFVNGGKAAAYREDKRVYLPKFISPKNPFAPKAVAEKSIAVMPAKKVIAPAKPLILTKTQKIPVFSAPRPIRATTWTEKLNPFRAPALATPMPTVQPELSLDTVKVIHNDLTGADVEMVPVKSRTNSPCEPVKLTEPREAWEFLGERLLKTV